MSNFISNTQRLHQAIQGFIANFQRRAQENPAFSWGLVADDARTVIHVFGIKTWGEIIRTIPWAEIRRSAIHQIVVDGVDSDSAMEFAVVSHIAGRVQSLLWGVENQ